MRFDVRARIKQTTKEPASALCVCALACSFVGLRTGSPWKLVHLNLDRNNIVVRVWLEICGSTNIGRKKREKKAQLAVQCGVSNAGVPIELRSASMLLTSDKKTIATRIQLAIWQYTLRLDLTYSLSYDHTLIIAWPHINSSVELSVKQSTTL